jgi:hypothetical protein
MLITQIGENMKQLLNRFQNKQTNHQIKQTNYQIKNNRQNNL